MPVSASSAGGRILRLPFRLIPREMPVFVLRGPSRGMRWLAGSAPHGAWLGTLERPNLQAFVDRIRPGMVVWDIGANVGLYTLPSGRKLRAEGEVVAFEPLARNVAYLERHVRLNRLSNVRIVEAAITREDGPTRLTSASSPSEAHLDPSGTMSVTGLTLDRWYHATKSRPPDLVKIDVEGAEVDVLSGGAEVFVRFHPTIHLSLHGEAQRSACVQLLRTWRYRLESLDPLRDLDGTFELAACP